MLDSVYRCLKLDHPSYSKSNPKKVWYSNVFYWNPHGNNLHKKSPKFGFNYGGDSTPNFLKFWFYLTFVEQNGWKPYFSSGIWTMA